MSDYLKLRKSNCKNCYKCIRHCPVKSIRFADNQAYIVNDECILCGQCFVACPQNAKEIRSDIGVARALIASGTPVYASIAPSFVANYDGLTIRSLEKALLRLGFAGVEETAVGAQMVKNAYDEMCAGGEHDVIISSCCHSVNLLIQKHYPEALPYLAKVLSPMLAHGKLLKERHPGAHTVFIGPCISKKDEAARNPGMIDCVLTFEELSEWLTEEKMALEPADDIQQPGRSRLFPLTGGILRSMSCKAEDYTYIAIDGMENCINALHDILEGKLSHCFIEMSSCIGSCIGGPAMAKNRRLPISDAVAVNRYAGRGEFDASQPTFDTLSREYPFLGTHKMMPGSSAIEEILRKMGKQNASQELNCGSCGYNTCREKAIAVLQGKADLTMCLPFLKEKAESFSDTIINNTPNGIIVLNENLEVQQINAAARHIMNIRDVHDVLGEQVVRILDPQIFFDVLQRGRDVHDKRVYLAEYDRYVEESIIYDRSYHILICVMRDVTDEENVALSQAELRRQTVDITDKVIEKQMRVVQEIASLLGETTAETKIALTKLKESLNND